MCFTYTPFCFHIMNLRPRSLRRCMNPLFGFSSRVFHIKKYLVNQNFLASKRIDLDIMASIGVNWMSSCTLTDPAFRVLAPGRNEAAINHRRPWPRAAIGAASNSVDNFSCRKPYDVFATPRFICMHRISEEFWGAHVFKGCEE